MARKTTSVEELRTQVNQMLAESICSAECRQGMINVLEQVLHKTGNYNGFGYLCQADIPFGHKPGIRTSDKPFEQTTYEERFKDVDRTRVRYL